MLIKNRKYGLYNCERSTLKAFSQHRQLGNSKKREWGAYYQEAKNMMKQEQLLKVRGVLRHKDSILFCYNKAQRFHFLPGGSLEPGENLTQCLARELQEECQLQLVVDRFLGCLECHWHSGQTHYQELNFVFQLYAQKVPIPGIVRSLEDHISFDFLKEADIKAGKYQLLPKKIVQFLDEPAAPHYLLERQ